MSGDITMSEHMSNRAEYNRAIDITTAQIAEDIAEARKAAHDKHGHASIESGNLSSATMLVILMEEIGEAAHEMTYDSGGSFESVRAELIDVAAVTVAWIAELDLTIAIRRDIAERQS